MSTPDTRQIIMEAARSMVQDRGYNSLSFRELAKEVGVKSASIHYHFPTKSDLATALARKYADDLVAYLNDLMTGAPDWKSSLASYVKIFRHTLERGNRMCLAGMLSAERGDLSPEVRVEVERFNDLNVQWLCKVLAKGKPKMEAAAVKRWAFAILAAIEGAQLVSRGYGDVKIFDDAMEAYRTTGLIPAAPQPPPGKASGGSTVPMDHSW